MKVTEYKTEKGERRFKTVAYIGTDIITGKQVQAKITASTRKELSDKIAIKKQQFKNNGFTSLKKAKLFNFSDLCSAWFDIYKTSVKTNTKISTETILKVYILPALGSYKLNRINSVILQNVVNDWHDQSQKGKIRKNYQKIFQVVKRICAYGVSIEALEENPCLKIYLPKMQMEKKKKIKFYTKEQLADFLEYFDEKKTNYYSQVEKTLFYLLAYSGLRIGEAMALEWKDINFLKKTISVTKTTNVLNLIEATPKTRKSNRVVYVDSNLIQLLKEWQTFQKLDKIRIGSKQATQIFSSQMDNEIIGRAYFYHVAQMAAKKKNLPFITLHGFRHTYASLLLASGVPYKEIQE